MTGFSGRSKSQQQQTHANNTHLSLFALQIEACNQINCPDWYFYFRGFCSFVNFRESCPKFRWISQPKNKWGSFWLILVYKWWSKHCQITQNQMENAEFIDSGGFTLIIQNVRFLALMTV